MHSFLYPRLPLCCLAALVALLFLLPPFQGPARAAALAADHTVLYYLIEMQRRVRKNCGGRSMPEAPSLIPSAALRDIAGKSAASGQSPEAVAASSGLAGTAFLAASASGNNPQQAFDSLNAAQCTSLMGGEYRYVGAAASGNRWIVILAAAEPGAPAPASHAQTPAAPASPRAAGQDEPGSWAGEGDLRIPPNRMGEAAPASPVVVGEMALGAQGKAVGPVFSAPPHSPSGSPEPHPLPDDVYDPSQPAEPGSWGGPGDLRIPEDRRGEAAPAAPVVVGEMQVDASGKVRGHVLTPSGDPRPSPGFVSRTAPPAADPGPPPGLRPPVAQPQGQDQPQDEFAAGQPSFVPPQAPGPFGASYTPGGAPAPAPRPGVVPLQDARPAQPMEFVAPNAGRGAGTDSPLSAGSSESRRMPRESGVTQAPGGGDLLDLINKARARGGNCGGEYMPPAPALSASPVLTRAAAAHAADMARRHYFSSTTPDGVTLGRRLTAAGYEWGLVAEDIAAMDAPAAEVLRSWLAEPRQCRNIMDAEYRDAGLGRDPSDKYWVFTLAVPLEEGAIKLR